MSRDDAPKRSRRYWRWLRDLGLVLLVVFGVHLYQTRDTVGGPAPPLAGTDIHGQRQDLASLRGEPVLVHFWATWCPICALEQDSIEAIAADWPVLSVALEDTGSEELRAFMAREGLSFPVLRDVDGGFASRFGVRGVPTSFVVDGTGRIRFTTVGYTTGPGLRLRLWLAAR
ncbi:MAG: protein disulfide oxidoreductase [Thiohalobacteraceae bacterium]